MLDSIGLPIASDLGAMLGATALALVAATIIIIRSRRAASADPRAGDHPLSGLFAQGTLAEQVAVMGARQERAHDLQKVASVLRGAELDDHIVRNVHTYLEGEGFLILDATKEPQQKADRAAQADFEEILLLPAPDAKAA